MINRLLEFVRSHISLNISDIVQQLHRHLMTKQRPTIQKIKLGDVIHLNERDIIRSV